MQHDRCLHGGGEIGKLMRELDWSSSPVGPVDAWPQSLRTAVSICLGSRHPIAILWGPEAVQFYNDAFRPILGKKHPFCLGRPAGECFPEVWTDLGPLLEGVRITGEATWAEDFRLIFQRNGFEEEIYLTFSYSPLRDESDGIGGVFCACSETTQRVLLERRLSTLRDLAARSRSGESLEEAGWRAMEALAENYNDIPFAALFADTGEMLGQTGLEHHYSLEGQWPLHKLATTSVEAAPKDLKLVIRPARPRPHNVMVAPLPGPAADRPLALLVLGISPNLHWDDAYQKFMQQVADQVGSRLRDAIQSESLREAQRKSEDASRAKTDFLANMSHEIRTPMTAVLGYAEILKSNLQNPEDVACLEVIQKNGRHLMEIINQMLDLSKIEAGKLYLDLRPIRLREVVQEAVSLVKVQAEEKNLRLNVTFAGAVPHEFVSDAVRLRQILVNLLGNAVKFTQQGSVTLRIWFQNESRLLTFEVADTGMGIQRENVGLLFRPFGQVDGVSKKFGGTGLGLAISRQLVELLGGTIEVISELGVGSIFRFTVATGDVAPEMLEPHFLEAPARAEEDLLRGKRIMVVDDRQDIRILVSSYLEDAGATVLNAAHGLDAIQQLENTNVDLLILDMQMPVMDGYETARRLRQSQFHAPILALTAKAMKGDRELCMQAGCTDYFSKPVESDMLIRRAWELIQNAKTVELRVLVVEDNPMASMAMSAMVENLECTVKRAADGKRALELAGENHFDLIFLDLQLPDASGYDVLDQLRTLPSAREAYVVAHTGRAPDEVEATGRGNRFDEVMQKPAQTEQLHEMLRRVRTRLVRA